MRRAVEPREVRHRVALCDDLFVMRWALARAIAMAAAPAEKAACREVYTSARPRSRHSEVRRHLAEVSLLAECYVL